MTCAFSGTRESEDLLVATAQMSLRVGGSLRVVTFGVRGRTMYPPEVGLHAEDVVLEQWTEQVAVEQADRAGSPALPRPAAGEHHDRDRHRGRAGRRRWTNWNWDPGEVLVVGSSPIAHLARVFLGSRAIKIIRYSPVPVVVVPAAIAASRAATSAATVQS